MAAVKIYWIVLVGVGTLHKREVDHSIPQNLHSTLCLRTLGIISIEVFFCWCTCCKDLSTPLTEWDKVRAVCQHMTSQHSEPPLASNKWGSNKASVGEMDGGGGDRGLLASPPWAPSERHEMQEKALAAHLEKIRAKTSKNTRHRAAKSCWCKQKMGGSPRARSWRPAAAVMNLWSYLIFHCFN